MAGAGFKTFNTGDVLTASDVNTYLMQQTVMVFASSAARTSALGANVAEGMFSYLTDTNVTQYYDGSTWVTLSTGGDITEVTAGTGLTGGGTSGAVSLAFDVANYGGGQWAAAKNKCLNGDFRINQRAFSTATTNNVYTFDRWVTNINGTGTISAQTFTAGTAPVTGYEAINFIRLAASSQGAGNYVSINQRIEDVRVFANQTFTVSFWAKASSGTPKVSAYIGQSFGSGGSAAVYTYGSAPTITTSWARYSITITAPSISGKTIGTGSYLDLGIEVSDSFNTNLGAQNATIDIWGIQAEAGSTATPFQTATGTIQGELAACQRYYFRSTSGTAFGGFGIGVATATTAADIQLSLPVVMRVQSTTLEYSTLGLYQTGSVLSVTNLVINHTTSNTIRLGATVASGLTSGAATQLLANNSTSAYLGVSAEL